MHVGPQAERIGAIAFTVGSDIYFAPGRFQPDTVHGQQLLGHELAHVVQQRAGRVRNPLGSGLAVVQDHALEAEADRLGQRAAAHLVGVQAKMAPGAVQPSSPVRISVPVSAGPGGYRLTAGAGGRQVGSVLVAISHPPGAAPVVRPAPPPVYSPQPAALTRPVQMSRAGAPDRVRPPDRPPAFRPPGGIPQPGTTVPCSAVMPASVLQLRSVYLQQSRRWIRTELHTEEQLHQIFVRVVAGDLRAAEQIDAAINAGETSDNWQRLLFPDPFCAGPRWRPWMPRAAPLRSATIPSSTAATNINAASTAPITPPPIGPLPIPPSSTSAGVNRDLINRGLAWGGVTAILGLQGAAIRHVGGESRLSTRSNSVGR